MEVVVASHLLAITKIPVTSPLTLVGDSTGENAISVKGADTITNVPTVLSSVIRVSIVGSCKQTWNGGHRVNWEIGLDIGIAEIMVEVKVQCNCHNHPTANNDV